MGWPPRYRDGQPVKPKDIVQWRGNEYSVLALWIDHDDNTNVSLYVERKSPGDRAIPRVNSNDLTFVRR